MPDEYGICIDCGAHTALRLLRRFPHICTECLFPLKREDEVREEAKRYAPRLSLVEDLAGRVLAIGAIKPGERRMDG